MTLKANVGGNDIEMSDFDSDNISDFVDRSVYYRGFPEKTCFGVFSIEDTYNKNIALQSHGGNSSRYKIKTKMRYTQIMTSAEILSKKEITTILASV